MNTGKRHPVGEDPSLTYYYKEVERHPQLTPAQEREIAKRIENGDQQAREELVKANLRFVIHVARGFQNQGLSMADLINEGNVGLMTAAHKFKPEKGHRFITYAVWWIRQNILKALEVQTRCIRIPANIINDLNKLRKTEIGLSQSLERYPDPEELAAEANLTVEKVDHTLESVQNAISLDSPVYDDASTTLRETLCDTGALHPEAAFIESEMAQNIHMALGALSERDRHILRLYFGFEGDAPATYRQIGDALGVSRERVRQIKEDALHRLRHPAISKKLMAYCS